MFPMINETVQKYFEETDGKLPDDFKGREKVPDICGFKGRACRQMGKEEGANRMLCTDCPLKDFSDKNRLLAVSSSIIPTDEIILEDDKAEVTYELWFDVDRVFGTDTKDDDAWINMYTFYDFSTEEVSILVLKDTPDGTEEVDYSLSESEKQMILEKMKDYYREIMGQKLVP